MDYGKYKYEQSVREREARKNQSRTSVKELRMKVRIGDHDFDINRRKAEHFLAEGDKVKVTIRFRGREQERPEYGRRLLDRLADQLGETAALEQLPKMEGRNMTMVLAPTRRSGGGGRRADTTTNSTTPDETAAPEETAATEETTTEETAPATAAPEDSPDPRGE